MYSGVYDACDVTRVYVKKLTIFPCQGAKFQSYSHARALGQGKFVCVYGPQGKLDKCRRNTSMVLANNRQP